MHTTEATGNSEYEKAANILSEVKAPIPTITLSRDDEIDAPNNPSVPKDKNNLIDFLNQLQHQAAGTNADKASGTIPVVEFIHYKGILKQASVREHLIERVVKVILKTAEAGFTFPGLPGIQFQSDTENDTVDPIVKQCGDKNVTKLFRRYGIYKIYPYNKTKTELDFIVITAQKSLYTVSLQRRQKIPLTKGFKEVKLSLEDAVGLLLASIIIHHKTHGQLQNTDILPSEQ